MSALCSLILGYWTISFTPILSKIYEGQTSTMLCCFMERSGLFPSHQYAYKNRVGTCDARLDIVCAGQREQDGGRQLALVLLSIGSFTVAYCLSCGMLPLVGPILAVMGDFLRERTQIVKLMVYEALLSMFCPVCFKAVFSALY